MSSADTSSSAWVVELRKQLLRGKHVILHGNVHDRALVDGALLQFTAALEAAILGTGCEPNDASADQDRIYAFTVWHNVVDGLFATTEETVRTFDEIRLPHGGSRSSLTRTTRGWQIQSPSNSGGERDHAALLSELTVLRNAIAVRHERPFAFVLELAEKLISSEDNQPLIDRKAVALIKLAAERAAVYTGTGVTGTRNALVLTASKLGQIPPWLYRDTPAFQLVAVTLPDLRERKVFLDRFLATSFHVDEHFDRDADRRSRIVDDLAGMTDGFPYFDLEALGKTSEREALSAERPAELVNYFRFGTLTDPWEELRHRKFGSIVAHLEGEVFGQPNAVQAAARALISAVGGISADPPDTLRSRPRGVLFFVGPTGVGKTELAKSIARFVFGDPLALARFDMSEYQREHDVLKLIGSPPSYVGYGEGGQLTNRLRARPFSVLLFDEVEKADPKILDVFLQILDEGRLTDGAGDTVSFAQSLIIFTSNEGSGKLAPGLDYPRIVDHFKKAIQKSFIETRGRPELLGRIGLDNVVVFDELRTELVDAILEKVLANVAANAKKLHGRDVSFDASIAAGCASWIRDNAKFGGRAVRNFVDSFVVPAVNIHALEDRTNAPSVVTWHADDKRCEVRRA